MRITFLFVLLGIRCLYAEPIPSNPRPYQGEFSQINASGECETFFETVAYTAKFYLTGFSGRTAVLFLESRIGAGAFHRMSQVGLFGYNNDFKVDRTYQKGSRKIHVQADGVIGPRFILFDQSITILTTDDEVVCSGYAEFSGFN